MIAIYRFLTHRDDDQALEEDGDLDEARDARVYTDDERDRLVNALHDHSEARLRPEIALVPVGYVTPLGR